MPAIGANIIAYRGHGPLLHSIKTLQTQPCAVFKHKAQVL